MRSSNLEPGTDRSDFLASDTGLRRNDQTFFPRHEEGALSRRSRDGDYAAPGNGRCNRAERSWERNRASAEFVELRTNMLRLLAGIAWSDVTAKYYFPFRLRTGDIFLLRHFPLR